MSLVNLAHVCSHLQNASLARLGLTSIPYTKWHLSLALLLQKQGFLSQVKLGGLSPPASCFGHGPRDDHRLTNHPHGNAGRNRLSPEAALALVIRRGLNSSQLREQGFDQEAIDFAERHSVRRVEELEAMGWQNKIVQLVLDTKARADELADQRETSFEKRLQLCETEAARQALLEELGKTVEQRRVNAQESVMAEAIELLPPVEAAIVQKYKSRTPKQLSTQRFAPVDIFAIAGRSALVTEREIRNNGITIEAMGMPITNQSITLPREEFQDPDKMEAEGVVTRANRASRRLWLGLKYYESSPVLSKARMISKPTKRIWLSTQDLSKIVRGSQAGEVKPMTQIGEIMAVSTDKGIMEARECVERRIGGMPLCRVW